MNNIKGQMNVGMLGKIVLVIVAVAVIGFVIFPLFSDSSPKDLIDNTDCDKDGVGSLIDKCPCIAQGDNKHPDYTFNGCPKGTTAEQRNKDRSTCFTLRSTSNVEQTCDTKGDDCKRKCDIILG